MVLARGKGVIVTNMDRSKAWQAIRCISREAFDEKIESEGLAEKRKNLLFKFLQGEIQVSYRCKQDIEEYALKLLMPDVYELLPHEGHQYSSCETYEFDPPKNGQNIIKHGIGFGEVVSYSRQFGTLTVPLPAVEGEQRCVIFSDLNLTREGDKLELPPSGIREMNYTISIAQRKVSRFRFISSRLMSTKKEKYEATTAQALREIIPDEQARQGFINHCVEILEAHLIRQTPAARLMPEA